MQNKVWIGLVGVLVTALVGIYMVSVGSRKLGTDLATLSNRIDKDFQHLNARTAPYVYGGAPMGYVIQFENGVKFYFSGDTDVFSEMKSQIGDYYQPDVAFLSMGGYFTMGPKGAALAASWINPKKYVIPSHYKSFPILEQTPDNFFAELRKYNLASQPLAFEIGEEKEVLGVKVRWLGHASWLFESPKGIKILIDPSVKLSAVWPDELRDLAVFKRIDLILLTHSHPDHVVTSDLKRFAELYDPVVFSSYDLGGWLSEQVPLAKVFNFLNIGGEIDKDKLAAVGFAAEKIGDIRIYATTATHSSIAWPQ